MEINQSTFFANYKERMKRLALYEPLITLQNKNTKDLNNVKIDMYDLGLMTLLFFYECKLLRKKEIGVEELAMFLFETTSERYTLDVKKVETLAMDIIRIFRPASGRRLSKTFYDWELKKEDTIYYSILKAGKSNITMNKQYYELDEDGLELIFSTREYYSEFQLSINQMLLRKQLEKGEFSSALRQIDEMQINVESLYERITKIKQEIGRSVVSELVYDRYKALVDDIYIRLERESEEFKELKVFINSALNDMRFKQYNEKDSRVYHNALQVSRALGKVHNMHDDLLKKCIEVQTTALTAAKESLYYSGVESFNFNKEVVSYCVSNGVEPEIVKAIAQPFLSLEKCEIWSPLTVFFPQRVYRREKGAISSEYLETTGSEAEQQLLLEVFYQNMMELCVKNISENNELILSDFIDIIHKEKPELLKLRLFYDFWITMHQLSPVIVDSQTGDKVHTVLGGVTKCLMNQYKAIEVKEIKELINIGEDFKISNMKMVLENKYDV